MYQQSVDIESLEFYDNKQPNSPIRVPHFKQKNNWDCGLACCMMVLMAFQIRTNYQELKQICTSQSIWTVDLVYLLRWFGLHVSLYTTYPGVNPNYISEEYYRKEYNIDELRINYLFHNLEQVQIPLYQKSLSNRVIQELLKNGQKLLITLVDNRELKNASLCGCFEGCNIFTQYMNYQGHFIVVIDYDCQLDLFTIQDPASISNCSWTIKGDLFQRSRQAHGTDEDIIIIDLERQDQSQNLKQLVFEMIQNSYLFARNTIDLSGKKQ